VSVASVVARVQELEQLVRGPAAAPPATSTTFASQLDRAGHPPGAGPRHDHWHRGHRRHALRG
jgi:hypothetical protein